MSSVINLNAAIKSALKSYQKSYYRDQVELYRSSLFSAMWFFLFVVVYTAVMLYFGFTKVWIISSIVGVFFIVAMYVCYRKYKKYKRLCDEV